MATGVIEVATSYTAQTTNATSQFLNHNVPGPFGGQDCWGHWTIRGTVRNPANSNCKHFYQRVSGIWTSAALFALTGVQPAQEAESTMAMVTTALTVSASGDDMVITINGLLATTLNWFVTVVTHNVYAEN